MVNKKYLHVKTRQNDFVSVFSSAAFWRLDFLYCTQMKFFTFEASAGVSAPAPPKSRRREYEKEQKDDDVYNYEDGAPQERRDPAASSALPLLPDKMTRIP